MTTTVNVNSTTISAKPNRKQPMFFEVIVTFSFTQETLQALERADHPDCNMLIDGFQAIFNMSLNIYTNSSHDSVMRRLKREVEKAVAVEIGLDESYLVKISTCAAWKQWEELTGKDFWQEANASKLSPDGKFYY